MSIEAKMELIVRVYFKLFFFFKMPLQPGQGEQMEHALQSLFSDP